jgi:hypothetical protein
LHFAPESTVPYHRYVFFLKWLTLSLLACAAVLFTVHVPRGQVALYTVWPRFALNSDAATVVVGVFGTIIIPYLFFWQASEEIEDMRGAALLIRDSGAAAKELRRIRWDTWSGMLYSDVTASLPSWRPPSRSTWRASLISIRRRRRQVRCGLWQATSLTCCSRSAFSGVGLIGVPVLAGSRAYALCEAMGWNWGLERKATDARAFYGIIAVSVLAGLVIQHSPISPMKALFWSAVINGVIAVPLIGVIILLASKKSVKGAFTATRSLIILGWIATAVMGRGGRWNVHSRLGPGKQVVRVYADPDMGKRLVSARISSGKWRSPDCGPRVSMNAETTEGEPPLAYPMQQLNSGNRA